MAEYITFAPKDPDGALIDNCFVTILGADHSILFNALEFGALPLSLTLNTILLEPRDYTLWVRSNGYIFAFQIPLTVVGGDGPTSTTPRVVDLVATSTSTSAEQSTGGWARVFGWAGLDLPGTSPGQGAQGLAVRERLPRGNVSQTNRVVHIWRLGPSRLGESASLLHKEYINLALDLNGYFEVILLPGTLYRIGVPNVAGLRYFTTPSEGESANVETLIDASRQTSPYAMLGGMT